MNEKAYKTLIASMPCIVTGGIAEVHHVKCFNNGYGRVSDFLTIPLCPELHRNGDDAIHINKSLFEDRYGREIDLLAKTIQAVAAELANKKLNRIR